MPVKNFSNSLDLCFRFFRKYQLQVLIYQFLSVPGNVKDDEENKITQQIKELKGKDGNSP